MNKIFDKVKSEEQLPLQFLVKCKSQVQLPEKSSYQN